MQHIHFYTSRAPRSATGHQATCPEARDSRASGAGLADECRAKVIPCFPSDCCAPRPTSKHNMDHFQHALPSQPQTDTASAHTFAHTAPPTYPVPPHHHSPHADGQVDSTLILRASGGPLAPSHTPRSANLHPSWAGGGSFVAHGMAMVAAAGAYTTAAATPHGWYAGGALKPPATPESAATHKFYVGGGRWEHTAGPQRRRPAQPFWRPVLPTTGTRRGAGPDPHPPPVPPPAPPGDGA